jgi:RHS repeat-associated protein
VTKYFAWAGGQIVAEYDASGANALIWKTSYVYMGGRLLATTSGADGTETRFHHPDRLGTRLATAYDGTVVTEQFTMPFGNMLPFTSVYGGENPYQNPTLANPSKKRFTSYDRSAVTTLDYAVNRYYSAQQGRFTQVDPIGMASSELANPQSLNLYAYVENDPINSTDPLGLDGVIWSFLGPFPTGGKNGGGGGGLKIGPFGLSFSFGGGNLFSFGAQDPKKEDKDESFREKWDKFIRMMMWQSGVPATPDGDVDHDMEVMMGNKYGNTGSTIGDFMREEAVPAMIETGEILQSYVDFMDATGIISPLMQYYSGRKQADDVFLAMAINRGFGSFKSLKKFIGLPGAGNAWHHIVEQTKGNVRRFGSKAIHSTGNILSLPHGKGTIHERVSAYYSSKQPFTGGKTVREWLSTQSYREQYRYGIKILRQFGWKQRP